MSTTHDNEGTTMDMHDDYRDPAKWRPVKVWYDTGVFLLVDVERGMRPVLLVRHAVHRDKDEVFAPNDVLPFVPCDDGTESITAVNYILHYVMRDPATHGDLLEACHHFVQVGG